MNVLIVGAQLANKGAQSMLYITVDELKKRFSKCNVYFATGEEFDESIYAFNRLYYTNGTRAVALKEPGWIGILMYEYIKMFAKILLGKKSKFENVFSACKILKKIDLIIDISGFAIGDKWNIATHKAYINNIKIAMKYSIPMYLMPQSFGPLNYESEEIDALLKKYLSYPRIIFARENDGKEALSKYQLRNVVLSTDLVLQNNYINVENVFRTVAVEEDTNIFEKSVGIVPNSQCFKHGNSERNIKMYSQIVDKLLKTGYDVVLFRHSRDDLYICELIKNEYRDNERVHLVTKEFSCLEYDEYVRHFDFIICSRYHGIVHAYRSGIPCVALGWAIKYRELLRNVNQEQYVFDITGGEIEVCAIENAIEQMIQKRDIESNIIMKAVSAIQEDNCFDIMEKDYRMFLGE